MVNYKHAGWERNDRHAQEHNIGSTGLVVLLHTLIVSGIATEKRADSWLENKWYSICYYSMLPGPMHRGLVCEYPYDYNSAKNREKFSPVFFQNQVCTTSQ